MKKILMFAAILSGVGLLLSWAFWSQVPDPMPIHWNLAGEPDRFASKTFGLLLLPSLIFFIPLLIGGILAFDPRAENVEHQQSRRAVRWIVGALSIFLLVLHGYTIYVSTQPGAKLAAEWILVMVGGLIAVMGWVLPQMKSNWFVGIRTPWSLSSEVVWKKTHDLAGSSMLWGGLATIPSVLLLPRKVGFLLAIGWILLSVLVPVVMSYVYYLQEQKEQDDEKE